MSGGARHHHLNTEVSAIQTDERSAGSSVPTAPILQLPERGNLVPAL
jgi:hypothetical protein